MSHQTLLDNFTDFTAEQFVLCDNDGQEVLLIVVVATFEAIHPGGVLQLAKDQYPVRPVVEHYGDPASSSICYESNIALEKPFVDMLINGYAYSSRGSKAPNVTVSVQIGDIHKSLLVQGNRRWTSGLMGMTPSRPEMFYKMPIIYERAFGGEDLKKRSVELRNPVGLGYHGALSHDFEIKTQIPNIEYPDDRMKSLQDCPRPAGFGAVSRNCQQRVKFAGTYDDDWLNERWPLLPLDFDSRFNQTAPEDQQSRTLSGGEKVKLSNMTEDGKWEFNLPRLDIPVHLCYEGHVKHVALRMDTILIEPELFKVTMTSRLNLNLPRNRVLLREVVLGHMYPGWIRAKATGKNYVDKLQTMGVNPKKPNFHL